MRGFTEGRRGESVGHGQEGAQVNTQSKPTRKRTVSTGHTLLGNLPSLSPCTQLGDAPDPGVHFGGKGTEKRGWRQDPWSWVKCCVLAALLGVTGCATVWDDFVTNRERFTDLFAEQEDPYHVIENSPSGDKRAEALQSLPEPAVHGGSEQDQRAVLNLLKHHATNDKMVICRLAAIEALGRFRDPRAVDALKDAYYRAKSQGISGESSTIVRCHALRALGKTRQPQASSLLLTVLREPAVVGSAVEKRRKTDERIAAARALGEFNHPDSAYALVKVLRDEKNPALRYRAHQSLVRVTGREYPPDATIWANYLSGKPLPADIPQPSLTDKMIRLISTEP